MMNEKNRFSILLLTVFLLLGLKVKEILSDNPSPLSTTSTEPRSTIIPPGQCGVSLTVHPSPAILGSLIRFHAHLNCSVVPPIEYQCCYYFWHDNISDNQTVTAGLVASILPKIYDEKTVKKNKYIMEVTVCWLNISDTLAVNTNDITCDFKVAVNTTTFELTDTLNGILKIEQDRDFHGNPSVLMVGKPASAVFVPTDERLEVLIYKWSINGTNYLDTANSSIQFIPPNVGLLSIKVHVFDNVSHQVGDFNHLVHCKDPILDAFIKGEKHLLVEENRKFVLMYLGSAPFTFCWLVEPSDSPYVDPHCLYDFNSTYANLVSRRDFYIQTRNKSGKQKVIGNLTNDVSKSVLTFEFNVFARVNIRSGILVVILIVGVLMSSLLTYMIFRKQPERRRIEVADFDFYPELTARTDYSLRARMSRYYEFTVLPFLNNILRFFKSAVPKQEMYTPLHRSTVEQEANDEDKEITLSLNSSTSETSKSLPIGITEPIVNFSPKSSYGSL